MSKPQPNDMDLDSMELEDIGVVYSSAKMLCWEEAYDLFEDFVLQSKKEFGVKHDKAQSSDEIYDEMLEEAFKAVGVEEYNIGDEHELHHAFMYGANQEPSLEEFKDAVTAVIKGEKYWESFARDSYE